MELQPISNPLTIIGHLKKKKKTEKALTYDVYCHKMAMIAGHGKQNDQKQQLEFHFIISFKKKKTRL